MQFTIGLKCNIESVDDDKIQVNIVYFLKTKLEDDKLTEMQH